MGREEQLLKLEDRPGDSTAKWGALLSALIIFISTAVVIFSNDPKSLGWFAYHPPLQTLAVVFFTYGILTLQPTSQPATKAAGLDRHQLAMLLLGFPALCLGTFSIIYKKWPYADDYIPSWHGTFGYVSIIWIVLQILGGGGSVWFGGAAFGGGARAKAIWKYHRLSGYVLLPLLLVTVHLGGARSAWATAYIPYLIRTIVYTLTPGLLLISVYRRTRSWKMQF